MATERRSTEESIEEPGKEMTGYFKENKLDRILVSGNGQTIYYATDQEIIVGANKTVSSDLTIYLSENKISRVTYTSQPT